MVEDVKERDDLEHLGVHWKLIRKLCINIYGVRLCVMD
jgi:hypothetical protein